MLLEFSIDELILDILIKEVRKKNQNFTRLPNYPLSGEFHNTRSQASFEPWKQYLEGKGIMKLTRMPLM